MQTLTHTYGTQTHIAFQVLRWRISGMNRMFAPADLGLRPGAPRGFRDFHFHIADFKNIQHTTERYTLSFLQHTSNCVKYI